MFEEEISGLSEVDETAIALRQEQETNLLLQETIADLELALEDRAWSKISNEVRQEFSDGGRRIITSLCRTTAVANPLVKRGLMLRIAYIWGGGLEVQARDEKVQDVVSQFWDDNKNSLTGSQAQEELERALGTDGNVFLAAFTSPLTGRVQVRSTPGDEIVDIVTNPEDSDEPWFYVREYTTRKLAADSNDLTLTRIDEQRVRDVHPALGFTPARRIKNLGGSEVKWDAPIVHVSVNRLDGWDYGIPDVYASLAWARAYKDFLTDWALLTKSLAKFAWRTVGDTKSRANVAISKIQDSIAASSALSQPTNANTAGQVVGSGPGISLEAIPKSGATIDADSGKPLAAMVAAGLGVSVVSLLADPGVTGARAVAETLDKPTVLEMGMRRMMWQGKLTQLLDYVIDQAVIAPKGGLKGTVKVDSWDRRVVEIAGGNERTLDWDWPALAELDPVSLVHAIVEADSTGKLPPEPVIKLLLAALGVKDVDEILDDMRDDQGNIVPPEASVGDAAAKAFARGEDPAKVAGSNPPPPKDQQPKPQD